MHKSLALYGTRDYIEYAVHSTGRQCNTTCMYEGCTLRACLAILLFNSLITSARPG